MAPKQAASSRGSGATIAKSLGKGTKSVKAASLPSSIKKISTTTTPSAKNARETTEISELSKDQLASVRDREDLDPDSPRYNAMWNDVKRKMGMPKNQPIHSAHMNRTDHILRVFDLDPTYGPCLGMSRLERWERAEKLGDEPPLEIKEILETKQGILQLHKSVLADKGV